MHRLAIAWMRTDPTTTVSLFEFTESFTVHALRKLDEKLALSDNRIGRKVSRVFSLSSG
jgi:hypothetical protein